MKIVENLCLEVDLNFTPELLKIQAIHPSNHCMVYLEINKSFFEDYEIQKQQSYTINTQLINKILKKCGKSMNITTKEDFLEFTGSKSIYKLNYFVGSEDERNAPDFETTEKWLIKSKELFSKITDFIDFSTIIKINSANELGMNTKAHMVNGSTVAEAKSISTTNVYCYYDLTYIDSIKSISDIFEDVNLEFSENSPLVIKNKNDDINFKFILASRMEEQNE
jgi:hypothetical protein